MSSTAPILRTTMFKLSDRADASDLVEEYRKVAKNARKDGKPYILACAAGPTFEDPRAQGYNFIAQTKFATTEDMEFYDNSCDDHAQLKASFKSKFAGPPLILYYQDTLTPVS